MGELSDLPGGLKLRRLREDADRTQLWVELEAGLGTGYLQRVESGKVAQPSRATLEPILTALEAPYGSRRDIMSSFGYAAPASPPGEAELAWAAGVAEAELQSVPFPAYVLDCLHRLVTWNGYFPKLLDVNPEHPLLDLMAGSSMLAPWFDPESTLGRMVLEPEEFLPALIRAFRFEMQRFRAEDWHAELLHELQAGSTLFKRYWKLVEREPMAASSARPVVPVRLQTPAGKHVQFRLSAERFAADKRFRFVHYFPADTETMQNCVEWSRSLEPQRSSERHASSKATTVPR